MALSHQELEAATAYVHKEKNGDAQASRFFSELAKDGTARSQEFLAVRAAVRAMSGYDTPGAVTGLPGQGGAGMPAAGMPAAGMPAAGAAGMPTAGVVAATAGLIQVQIDDCRKMTYLYAQGDHEGIGFFNGCVAGRAAGNQASSKMLALRDQILAKMGWVKVGNKMVKPEPAAAAVEPLQAGPVMTHVPAGVPAAAAHIAAVVPQLAVPVVGPQYLHVEEPAPQALPETSGIISGIPDFDMPGAIDTIQAAIDEERIFSAEAVQSMLNEIVKLRAAAMGVGRVTPVAAVNGIPVVAPQS